MTLIFKKSTAQPEFTVAASISGTVQEGQSLEVSWTVSKARSVTVEWVSWSDSEGTLGRRDLGYSTSLLIPTGEVGRYITCRVIAANPAGQVTSIAGPTAAVAAAGAPDPTFSVSPSISGTATVGETLTLTYTPQNATTELIQWYAYTSEGQPTEGRLTLGTGSTQVIPANADGYWIGATVRLFDADGDEAIQASNVLGPVTPGTEDPGAPELPRTTPSTLPPTGWDKATADVVLTDSTNLQSWINSNSPIDTSGGVYVVELTAGGTWSGKITFPTGFNTGQNYIVFRTSNYANLPAAGNRLQPSPANDADLATIEGPAPTLYTPTSITASGTTATATFASPHGLTSGYYAIEDVSVATGSNPYNTVYVYATAASSTTMTYTLAWSPTDTAPTGGVLIKNAQYEPNARIISNDAAEGQPLVTKLAFVGVQFSSVPHTYSYAAVRLGGTSSSQMHDGVCFYQCRFTTGSGRLRDTFLRLDGSNIVVSCCDMYARRHDFASTNVPNHYGVGPSEGVMGLRIVYGAGVRVYNNRLQVGGVSLFLSDNGPSSSPSDVTIDKNYMYRPSEWIDNEFHKNPFEIKGAIRMLMEGNIIQQTWDGYQAPAHLLVLKNQRRDCTDILIRNNKLLSGVSTMHVASNAANPIQRMTITNNLFYDVSRSYGNFGTDIAEGTSLYLTQSGGRTIQNLRITKNTIVAKNGIGAVRVDFGYAGVFGFVWRDNVVSCSKAPTGADYRLGWHTPYSVSGLVAINQDIADYVITNNVWVRRTAVMAEGDTRTTVKAGSTCENNYYYIGSYNQVGPAANEALFVDYTNNNFRINPAGSLTTAASDGGHPGADIDAIEAATANVETGTLV